jgi:translation initiation factor 2 beta subunit (eIF-2beta)/eIF-5
MTSTMTQIPMWKYKNTSYMLSLCFISSKVKDEIAQYIKTWKSQNILIQQHNNFFLTLKANTYFYC